MSSSNCNGKVRLCAKQRNSKRKIFTVVQRATSNHTKSSRKAYCVLFGHHDTNFKQN